MVDDDTYVTIITRYPIDNEHYFGTFLAVKGLLDEVENRQTTYDDWIATSSPSSPFTFTDLKQKEQLDLAALAIQGKLYSQIEPYLFGRKFAKECDLSPLYTYLAYRIKGLQKKE